ncbi:hypothetical protein GUJ93_ZPchr0860g38053 [Zizania palustris]|uniref:Nuclear pore protein n=1 Tax=Zizania palustris TaxID=103762 RepID=A0A8J5R656_ZIZPA|nr:hypothetical protein GUJ93_ZPchr0860g38053 [Zizania palustris]
MDGGGGGDAEMGGWSELLHSSTKLLEQAAPTPHFPPLQRNLDQLEVLSTKLKAKTVRAEAPAQSLSATRLLAREGINAEQLARDLKSFELKTTFEDVFPSEATTVEEYLQQLHEMAIVSSIQEAQKDNLRSFNNHMMEVLEDDWQKEKRDFLQSLSRLSTLPKRNTNLMASGLSHPALMPSSASSPQASSGLPSKEVMPIPNKTTIENKSSVYAAVVRDLNDARGRSLPLVVAFDSGISWGRVSSSKHFKKNVTSDGARQHLEWGHEKYILETINSHPALAALGGSVGNLQKIRAFLRVRLRDHGVLDFDATDLRRQPPVDTTWQQIYFCLRTGYYDEARQVAQSSRAAFNFAPCIQLLPAILYLSKEVGEEGYHVDALHISIALSDQGVLPDGVGSDQKIGIMDACAEAASIIRQYGSIYLRNGNLDLALEYYAQAAAAMGGGDVSWIDRGNTDQQRQRNLMLKQLLTEILLRDGGIQLLLGPSGMGGRRRIKEVYDRLEK